MTSIYIKCYGFSRCAVQYWSLVVIIFCLASYTTGGQANGNEPPYNPLNISNNHGASMEPSLVANKKGNAAVAWMDRSPGNLEIFVRQWDGTKWRELAGSASKGGVSSSPEDSWAPSLAYGPNDELFVVWLEGLPGATKVMLKHWNGKAWQGLDGSAGGLGVAGRAGHFQTPVVTVDKHGKPWVAWTQMINDNWNISVRRWNGRSWDQVNGYPANTKAIGNESRDSVHPSLTTDAGGMPVITWSEQQNGRSQIYLLRWNGRQWKDVDGSASGGGISDNKGASLQPALATTTDDSIVVTWKDDTSATFDDGKNYVRGNWQILLKRWNGTRWEALDQSTLPEGISGTRGKSELPTVAIAKSGEIYVAWQDSTSDQPQIMLRQWTGSEWTPVDNVSTTMGKAATPSLAVWGKKAFVVWSEDSSGNYEIQATRWPGEKSVNSLDSSTFAITPIDSVSSQPSLAIDSMNRPVMAWPGNTSTGSELFISFWNGQQWKAFEGLNYGGSVSNSKGKAFMPALALDANNNPVVAWEQHIGWRERVYLRRWTGNQWIEIGDSARGEGISSTTKRSKTPALALDAKGNPVVAWEERIESNSEILVKQYKCNWFGRCRWVGYNDSADIEGISSNIGRSEKPVLALTPDEHPVVAWQDNESGRFQVYVKHWTGRHWQELGTSSASGNGISHSDGDAVSPVLVVDRSGNPIVAWLNQVGNQSSVYALRWNGAKWTALDNGTGAMPCAEPCQALEPTMALDSKSRPVVLWIDKASVTNPVHVVRWSGEKWETLSLSVNDDRTSGIMPTNIRPAFAIGKSLCAAWVQAHGGKSRIFTHCQEIE